MLILEDKGLPNAWFRKITLIRRFNNKPYIYKITENRSEGEVSGLEIRIMFPTGETPTPIEWEVYSLSLKRTVSDRIWTNTPYHPYDFTASDEMLDIAGLPLLDLQISSIPANRLTKIVGPVKDDQTVTDPMMARELLLEGIRQVIDSLNDPKVQIKAYKPSPFEKNIQRSTPIQ